MKPAANIKRNSTEKIYIEKKNIGIKTNKKGHLEIHGRQRGEDGDRGPEINIQISYIMIKYTRGKNEINTPAGTRSSARRGSRPRPAASRTRCIRLFCFSRGVRLRDTA